MTVIIVVVLTWITVVLFSAVAQKRYRWACKIIATIGHGDDILFCNLHKAAPELLTRLEVIEHEAEVSPDMTLGAYFSSVSGDFVCRVLAKATGEKS